MLSFDTDGSDGVFIVQHIVDAIFILDFIMNWFTGYVDESNKVETDLKKIASHYLKSWFVIDCVSSIPWDGVIARCARRVVVCVWRVLARRNCACVRVRVCARAVDTACVAAARLRVFEMLDVHEIGLPY